MNNAGSSLAGSSNDDEKRDRTREPAQLAEGPQQEGDEDCCGDEEPRGKSGRDASVHELEVGRKHAPLGGCGDPVTLGLGEGGPEGVLEALVVVARQRGIAQEAEDRVAAMARQQRLGEGAHVGVLRPGAVAAPEYGAKL